MFKAVNKMHIAIAFDKNFITPTYTFLTSIFNTNPNNKFHIHAIASEVHDVEKEKIKRYVRENQSEITFYEINLNGYTGFVVPENSYYTIATYYRLFFPALLPESVKKFLYLDTDTVVVGDLDELYSLEIGHYPIAAVPDTIEKIRTDLGINEPNNYFNAGVLLINKTEWLKQEISEKAIEFLNDYPEKIKWVDQDALNGVLVNNWYKLNNRFNVTFFDIPSELPRREYQNFLKDKIVLHYTTGLHKPWSTLGENKFRYVYHDFLKQSPHAFVKKYVDFKFTTKHIYSFIRIRVVEQLYDYPKVVKYLKKLKS